eukprot:6519822-Alexandrium_andersonii.AAC.1
MVKGAYAPLETQYEARVLSTSMVTKSLLRLGVENDARQAHVAPLRDGCRDVRVHVVSFCGDSRSEASGVSSSPGRVAL